MSDYFIGEIRLFAFNFAPRSWAKYDGQLLAIAQNQARFTLMGTYYGGNDQTTFALPNLQNSVPKGVGNGPGLTPRAIGETGGTPAVTLVTSELAAHTHTLRAGPDFADLSSPSPPRIFGSSTGANLYNNNAGIRTTLATQTMSAAGGSQPHNNLQPYLVLNFCIALQGVFPSRQ